MGLLSWLFGRKSEDRPKAKLTGPGTFSVDIVGESHYQDALEDICGGHLLEGHEKIVKAVLIHEDDNPYDNKAIRVDIQGKTVGYLSRENARTYRKKMKDAGYPSITATCSAKIVGGWDDGSGDMGHFGVKLDIPAADQQGGTKGTSNSSEFSFVIAKPNPQELSYVKVGDSVKFWAPSDKPRKILIYRRGSAGGQGKLGLVPKQYAKVIANHRASQLPIETEINSVKSSACTIRCRLVSAEEVKRAEKEKMQKLRKELKKPYKPRKPLEFSIDAGSNELSIGEQLRLKETPSIDEFAEDINGSVLVFSSLDEEKIIEKSDKPAIKKKIVRLANTFDNLGIQVISKGDEKNWYKSEYKLRIKPNGYINKG